MGKERGVGYREWSKISSQGFQDRFAWMTGLLPSGWLLKHTVI